MHDGYSILSAHTKMCSTFYTALPPPPNPDGHYPYQTQHFPDWQSHRPFTVRLPHRRLGVTSSVHSPRARGSRGWRGSAAAGRTRLPCRSVGAGTRSDRPPSADRRRTASTPGGTGTRRATRRYGRGGVTDWGFIGRNCCFRQGVCEPDWKKYMLSSTCPA